MEDSSWLDASYMQKFLENSEKDDSIEVSSVVVKPATARGENYASDLYRVYVVFTRVLKGQKITETKSFIAKLAPHSGIREGMISDAGFFDTEISILSETVPDMHKMMDEFFTGSFGPQCLYSQFTKPVHLIIEDLTPKGFQTADRQIGLDLDHCLLAFRNLAVFHAGSVALNEKDPKAVTRFTRGMFQRTNYSMKAFFIKSMKSLAKETAKWPELSPKISEKLFKLSDDVYEKGCVAVDLRDDDFNVLNHGDYWVNNMMFRYDEQGKVVDHIFLDLQMAFYGSPALDILYFFATSPSEDVRINHRELVLREYHTALTNTMAKLKCKTKAPSFDELQELLRKRALLEVISKSAILPLVLNDKDQILSLDEIMGAEENPVVKGKLFRKVMTSILPIYDRMGLLDS